MKNEALKIDEKTRGSVLIVEDEELTAENVRESLEEAGYTITGVVDNGAEAVKLLDKHRPDLVIMDIGLQGDMDGISTSRQMRKIHKAGIIYLTGNDSEEVLDQAALTDHYAYLLKPLDEKSLLVSVTIAMAKRRNLLSGNSKKVCIGDYCFDHETMTMYRDGKPENLGKNEVRMIELLIQNIGRTIPHENVKVHVWGTAEKSDSAMRELIHRVRKKLDGLKIHTITGQVGLLADDD